MKVKCKFFINWLVFGYVPHSTAWDFNYIYICNEQCCIAVFGGKLCKLMKFNTPSPITFRNIIRIYVALTWIIASWSSWHSNYFFSSNETIVINVRSQKLKIFFWIVIIDVKNWTSFSKNFFLPFHTHTPRLIISIQRLFR